MAKNAVELPKVPPKLVQHEVIPNYIPQFRAFDPFDDDAFDKISIYFPFWVKPIKSSGSMLSFRIRSREDFDHGIGQIREQIHLISEPFNCVLEQANIPKDVTEIATHFCQAESIGGWRCTLEGYSFEGDVQTFGIIDSVRYEIVSSFFRYEYPSTLPDRVREEIIDVSKRVIRHIGFDNSAFNIEFYWEREHNTLWLLEVNTRVSQSHSDIFEKVDGSTNQQVTVQVA